MKAYGKNRKSAPKRNIPGTTRACPCCIPPSTRSASGKKALKKRARRAAKAQANAFQD